MSKKWSKETIKKAREITKKHCVNSDPKLFNDKLISDLLTFVENAKKLKRERA
jgi:hypothetical protein